MQAWLGATKTEEVFGLLTKFYDGYRFGGDLRVFNGGQIVNCLQYLFDVGTFPNTLVDINTNLSESVLQFLSKGWNDQFCLLLIQLLTKPVPFQLSTAFVIDEVRKELDDGKPDTLLSLMVYYRALTVVMVNEVSNIYAICIVIIVILIM